MAKTKYGENIITMASWFYQYFGGEFFHWGSAHIGGKLLGFNLSFGQTFEPRYWEMGPYPYRPHVHPYDELLFFMGADPNDISKLCGKGEVWVGWEEEKHVFTSPGVCICPKALPHCPCILSESDGHLQFGRLSFNEEDFAREMPLPKEPLRTDGNKYKEYNINFDFREDPSVGKIATMTINNLKKKNVVIEYMMCKQPFKFGKEPQKPEVHDFDELYIFTSGDPEDPTYLRGEAEIELGKEREIHKITVPTTVLVPKGTPHLPLTIKKVDKPFKIMTISFTDKPTVIKMA